MNDEILDILDETLDDLADLPSQELWPAGAYAASMKVSRMKDKVGAYVVNLTMQQVVELSAPSDDEPAEGDQTAAFIYTRKKDGTANEIGQGQFKTILSPLAAALDTRNIGEILEATKDGVDVIAVVKVRKSRDPNYNDSQEIVKIELP